MWPFKNKVHVPADHVPADIVSKNPNDFTLTDGSTQWESESYCRFCAATTCHKEVMADICNSCGEQANMATMRVVRSIRIGGEWCRQRKYGRCSFHPPMTKKIEHENGSISDIKKPL